MQTIPPYNGSTTNLPSKTIFDVSLSDYVNVPIAISPQKAQNIFYYFKHHWLFKWSDAHNDCEDRANAISILLDEWKVPNFKGWVFSGNYLKNEFGYLTNFWNYHVANVLPVEVNNNVEYFIIDPATLSYPKTLSQWANNVTESPNSYHILKHSYFYIFNNITIESNNWFFRDNENYKWTIEGLTGINGVDPNGAAMVKDNKALLLKTEKEFNKLKMGGSPFKN